MENQFTLSCCSTVDLPYAYMASRHIPVLFYTYTGILGRSIDVVNVLLFQAAVLLAYWVSRTLQKRGALTAPAWQAAGAAVQIAIAALFAVWTASPPELPLFVDPANGTRGIPGAE